MNRMPTMGLRLLLLIVAVCSIVGASASACAADSATSGTVQSRWTNVPRVVVVADVHGAYQQLTELLQVTEVIDADFNWIGGDTHLVSLGDLLDRGNDSRAVMDLLMKLQEQAPLAGGRVHVIIGNHEHMNLIGDLRYVSTGEYAAFASDETQEMREDARLAFAAAYPNISPEEKVAMFDDRYPPGYFAHRAAFRPSGHYGRWLLSLPILVVINDSAFVHGGLPGITARLSVGELNTTFAEDLESYLNVANALVSIGALPADAPAHDEMEAVSAAAECDPVCDPDDGTQRDAKALKDEFKRLSNTPVNGYDAPFWYRGSVYCRDILERPVLDDYLQALAVARVVVGHTVTNDRKVRAIRDKKVIMADTGMLTSYYSGRPSALIITKSDMSVQYLNPEERRPPESGLGPIAYGLTAAELEQALHEGTVKSIDKDSSRTYWMVTLDFAGKQIAVRFYPGGRRGTAKRELAAHELDEMLGTELVPVTVARHIDGSDGALQLMYQDEVLERERVEAGLPFTGWCPMQDQFQLMYAFDLLTANANRTRENIVYRRSDWRLRLTGHGDAFNSGRLSRSLSNDAVDLAPGVVAALARLDAEKLHTALDPYLDKRRIRSLLARRDALLEKFGR